MVDASAPGFRPPNAIENVAAEASQDGALNKKKKLFYYKCMVPRVGCLKLKVEEDEEGNVDMQVVGDDKEDPPNPTHLIVTVNGIIGSADNWKFAAKQFLRKYPRDVIVHCSKSNYGRLTFHGVDVMGDRLAKEVLSVIQSHPYVKKISFIGHSLGGVVARYAIAKLYECDPIAEEASQRNGRQGNGGDVPTVVTNSEEKTKGRIAGLEPVNFITSASPHLGSRGHRQVPFLFGFYTLENVAARLSCVLGRTGKHLFLTDREKGKTPLLLQMVHDTEDLKFISALRSFKRRAVYANVHFDKLVGWSSSSIRRRHELPRMRDFTRDLKYRHIVYAKTLENNLPQQEAPREDSENGHAIDYEEEMIRELTRMSWERFNVKFNGNHQRLLAHGSIQVQHYCVNSEGSDVVEHLVDTFVL